MKKLVLLLILSCGGLQAVENQKVMPAVKVELPEGVEISKAVKVKYKNYRGEVGTRSIIPMEVYWGQTEYHPHDQWLLKVWDVEKNAERIYAFKDIQEFDCK
jgi:hypothetical protein